jgi:putative ABC transport system permease protein
MTKFYHSLIEGFNIAWRALIASKTRALLTTLGIVIGVVTVTMMMMIIQGLNQSVAKSLSLLGSGTVYVERYPWIWGEDWWQYRNRPRLTMEHYKIIKEYSKHAETVGAYTYTARPIAFKDKTRERVGIVGVTPETADAMNWMPEFGRFISESDIISSRKVCVIGHDIQEKIFAPYNALGRKLRVGAHNYTVVGISEKRGRMFGESSDDLVMIPATTLIYNYGAHRDFTIVAKAWDSDKLEDLIDELTFLMRRARNIAPKEKNNFSINTQDAVSDLYKQLTAGIYGAGIVLGGISLLVGGIGIMNIMLVSVTERTWEIGMRKAVGAKTTDILWQFLVEAMLICMVGGTLGILIAYLGGKLIGDNLPTSLPAWLALSSMAFSALIGLIFGLFPAFRASRLDPITALRQE